VIAGLFAVSTYYVSQAQDGLKTIGHTSGPQVVTTSNLYYALSDMDGQLADILLIGDSTGLGSGTTGAQQAYNNDIQVANQALMQASALAKNDPEGQRTVQSVLNNLNQYELLAGQAKEQNKPATGSGHAPGRVQPQTLATYRQATTLMTEQLLPQAYNLTLDSATIVRRTYADKHAAIGTGRVWIGVTGVVVIIVLAGFQLYLAAGFRRLLSPYLALATVGTLALCVILIGVLSGVANHLHTAKAHGFDSVLALSRARATSNNASGDQTRFLLDPEMADTYQAVYLDKSQTILYVAPPGNQPATSLNDYYNGLSKLLGDYRSDPSKVPFLGFYGAEASNITVGAQAKAFSDVFASYNTVQQDDRQMRALVAANQTGAAIDQQLGPSRSDFNAYDADMMKLIGIHNGIFNQAIKDGDGELNGWDVGLPLAALALVGLVLAGIRPRLKEFR
jgi:hypothetical protein